MAFDLFASAKTTAIAALVSASFASPIVAQSDVVSSAFGGSGSAHAEQVIAGGVAFAMPEAWGRLGASAAAPDGEAASEEDRIGTVVSGVCPGGSKGADCSDGVQLTFITYSGKDGHELPLLSKLERQFDAQLARKYPGFAKIEARQRPGADGSVRYLDYAFTYRAGGAVRQERLAAFRHSSGSGVIALATGAKLGAHQKAIDEFLAGAHAAGGGEH